MVEDRYDKYGNRIIDEYNFFVSTECTWYEMRIENSEHITSRYPSYTSPHGSSTYWYDDDGVYRLSNHWGAVSVAVIGF